MKYKINYSTAALKQKHLLYFLLKFSTGITDQHAALFKAALKNNKTCEWLTNRISKLFTKTFSITGNFNHEVYEVEAQIICVIFFNKFFKCYRNKMPELRN